MSQTLGQRLAEARESAGLTQSQVAQSVGVNVSRISEWENDRYVPEGTNIMRLVATLDGADWHYVLTGERGPTAATLAEVERIAGELAAVVRSTRPDTSRAGGQPPKPIPPVVGGATATPEKRARARRHSDRRAKVVKAKKDQKERSRRDRESGA